MRNRALEVVLGAMYDFLGHLTTLDQPITIGKGNDTAPLMQAFESWAENHKLHVGSQPADKWKSAVKPIYFDRYDTMTVTVRVPKNLDIIDKRNAFARKLRQVYSMILDFDDPWEPLPSGGACNDERGRASFSLSTTDWETEVNKEVEPPVPPHKIEDEVESEVRE